MPGASPYKWFTFKAVKTSPSGPPTFVDIISHDSQPFRWRGKTGDFATTAHESCHQINAQLYDRVGGRGFYFGKDLAVVLPEPKFRKSQIAQFISPLAKNYSRYNSLYNIYFTQSPDSENAPLYLFNEWLSYTYDAAVNHELNDSAQLVFDKQALEVFVEFGHALDKAIDYYDPSYKQKYPVYSEVYAELLKRSNAPLVTLAKKEKSAISFYYYAVQTNANLRVARSSYGPNAEIQNMLMDDGWRDWGWYDIKSDQQKRILGTNGKSIVSPLGKAAWNHPAASTNCLECHTVTKVRTDVELLSMYGVVERSLINMMQSGSLVAGGQK